MCWSSVAGGGARDVQETYLAPQEVWDEGDLHDAKHLKGNEPQVVVVKFGDGEVEHYSGI